VLLTTAPLLVCVMLTRDTFLMVVSGESLI
jgi:hypothetical protein